ncbi:MAG: hypothetical protein WD359_01035, partial [Dehalococcoidia bacterium]
LRRVMGMKTAAPMAAGPVMLRVLEVLPPNLPPALSPALHALKIILCSGERPARGGATARLAESRHLRQLPEAIPRQHAEGADSAHSRARRTLSSTSTLMGDSV